jgi:hypothetical protein
MPVPTPSGDESEQGFISRCMGDAGMQEYDGGICDTRGRRLDCRAVARLAIHCCEGPIGCADDGPFFGLKTVRNPLISYEPSIARFERKSNEINKNYRTLTPPV